MVVDPEVRASILRILSEDRGAEIRSGAIAEQLGLDVALVEASLEVMQGEDLVKVTKYWGGGWGAMITSRGYLQARQRPKEASRPVAAAEGSIKGEMAVTETRARLGEQLGKVEELIERGSSATLEDMKDWVDWTFTVVKRAFGDKSGKLSEFNGVMMGGWPFDGESAQAEGYRQRLPEWRRLLRTWIREIDEFETPSETAERYIPPRSQFDAYVALKDMMETAAASLTVVDPYTGDATLQVLKAVGPDVHVRILTVKPDKDFDHVLGLFQQQWGGNIEVRQGPKELHDRFLLLDDKVFFSGASFKDLGQKGSFIGEIRTDAIKDAIRKDIEAWWEAAQPIT